MAAPADTPGSAATTGGQSPIARRGVAGSTYLRRWCCAQTDPPAAPPAAGCGEGDCGASGAAQVTAAAGWASKRGSPTARPEGAVAHQQQAVVPCKRRLVVGERLALPGRPLLQGLHCARADAAPSGAPAASDKLRGSALAAPGRPRASLGQAGGAVVGGHPAFGLLKRLEVAGDCGNAQGPWMRREVAPHIEPMPATCLTSIRTCDRHCLSLRARPLQVQARPAKIY